jgi:hypothetical protein
MSVYHGCNAGLLIVIISKTVNIILYRVCIECLSQREVIDRYLTNFKMQIFFLSHATLPSVVISK